MISVGSPQELKKLSPEQLSTYTQELRTYLIDVMAENGGHVAANLGVVELAVALHYVFDTPEDILIWDVGHQAYAHKAITGRHEALKTLRREGGVSGFTKLSESIYDAFGAGHSSTALSAAAGFSEGLWQKKSNRKVIAVVGDGALSAGLAFEGLNHLGHMKRSNTIVILNDNDMSISENMGWSSQASEQKRKFFETMGFEYCGPVDGHDLKTLIENFSNAKSKINDHSSNGRPLLIHVKTVKGKGLAAAEKNPGAFHGLQGFDRITEKPTKAPTIAPSYTQIFSQTLCKMAEKDQSIVAVTAAMPEGTGLSEFQKRFPERFYDVGIAESHAITFSAALRLSGMKPAVAIYSTFLQRGFDQLIHDVAIQKIPLTLFLDRAGLVGADGPTHHGVFDLSYLRMIPGFHIMAPKDENELQHMIFTALESNVLNAVRFPRGEGLGVKLDSELKMLPLGKAEKVLVDPNATVVIWAAGVCVAQALAAAAILKNKNILCEVVNARFIKPLDESLLVQTASSLSKTALVVTVEENSIIGGLGSAVLESLARNNISIPVLTLGVSDEFVEHGTQESLRHKSQIDAEGIAFSILKRMACQK